MSNYFSSLLSFGHSNGLGTGLHGACHIVLMSLEALLPRDVEAGLLEATDIVVAFDYGSHIGFRVQHENGEVLSAERVCSTYIELAQLLRDTYDLGASGLETAIDGGSVEASDPYQDPPYPRFPHSETKEPDSIDDALESIREAAIAQLDGEESDEDFEDDDGIEVDVVDDDSDAVDAEESEAVIITLEKPKGKAASKKYKADVAEMALTLVDYYADELEEIELDLEGLVELLGDVFNDQRSFDVDTALSFCDNFVDYLEFDEE